MSGTLPSPLPVAPATASGLESGSSGRRRLLPWVAAAAAAAALGPPLWTLGMRLWETTYYQHVPFYLAALAALAWWRCRGWRAARVRPGSGWVAAGLWAAALLLVIPSVALDTPLGAAVGGLLSIAAAAYTFGGPSLFGRIAPPWAAAWLALPLPLGVDQRFVVRLQALATDWASTALDMLGDRHLVAGTTVEMPGRSFFVEEACSGVNGLFASLAGVALYLVWNRRGLVRSLAVLAASVFWVLAANAVRVTTVVVLVDRYDLPVLTGWGHEALGVLTFAAAIGLTVSTDRFLLFVLPANQFSLAKLAALWRPADDASAAREAYAGDDGDDGDGARRGSRSRAPLRRPLWAAAAAGFGLAAGTHALLPAAEPAAVVDPDALKVVPRDALPEEWNGWRQVGFETVEREGDNLTTMGARSRIWAYRKGRVTALISMDGPFAHGWHDLQVCYVGNGWTCSDIADFRPAGGDGGAVGDVVTRMDMAKPDGRRGYVTFASHAIDDDAPIGPARGDRSALIGRFAPIAALFDESLVASGRQAEREPAYQVQVLVDSYLPLEENEVDAVDRLFAEMRDRLTAWSSAG